jgi:hypothetical protein
MIRFLQATAKVKLVLSLFVLTMAAFLTMLFYSIPAVEHFAPGKKLFDLLPSGYSYEYAMSLLTTLGSEGRDVYLNLQLPLDFIYPGLFAVSYSLLLVWVFKKGFSVESKIFYFSLIPFLGGIFDYLENICIVNMLKIYPDIPPSLVSLSSIFTILKSGFSTAFFILFFTGIYFAVRNSHIN